LRLALPRSNFQSTVEGLFRSRHQQLLRAEFASQDTAFSAFPPNQRFELAIGERTSGIVDVVL
jgi:hypothetical protein